MFVQRMMACLVASAITASAAAIGGGMSLGWHTIDGGGDASNGSGFQLTGTIGQPDTTAMSGGDFHLVGGFWADAGTPAEPCPADVDGSGVVDVGDLLLVLANWGGSGDGDINDDGTVDVSDLLELLSAWGAC
jgi:hypothetical protein